MKILFHFLLAASILILSACGTATSIPPTANVPITGGNTPTANSPAPSSPPTSLLPTNTAQPASGDLAQARQKIKHIVVIMQENRSFDEYFGTFPGANGIPMQNGVPTVCAPDPKTGHSARSGFGPMRITATASLREVVS
jgi:hypothetical protein